MWAAGATVSHFFPPLGFIEVIYRLVPVTTPVTTMFFVSKYLIPPWICLI
jgi:hypothetical protein